MAKVKKFIFPGTTLLISLYISGLFAVGIVFGYFCTLIFHKKVTEKEIVKPIFLNFGKWKIHFHHWIIGGVSLLVIWLGGWMSIAPRIFLGLIGGMVVHDFYSDRHWYKIVVKS